MRQLLLAAAVLVILGAPVSPAAPAHYQERVCEGVVKKREDPYPNATWSVPVYEFGTVDKRADPVQFGVGTCWVNDLKAPQHTPTVNEILKVCHEGDRCHIKAYGECQTPRIVEFPKEAKNCPSGFVPQRIIEVRKL
jgi:hypothetical protein